MAKKVQQVIVENMEAIVKKLLVCSILFATMLTISGMEPARQQCSVSTYKPARDLAALSSILNENYDTLVNPLNGYLFRAKDSPQEIDENILNELNNPEFNYAVIRNRNRTVGFIKYRPSVSTQDAMHINLLAIAKNHQQKGYGKRLIEYVAEQAQLLGLKSIQLCPVEDSEPFYQKMGFTPKPSCTATGNWIKLV